MEHITHRSLGSNPRVRSQRCSDNWDGPNEIPYPRGNDATYATRRRWLVSIVSVLHEPSRRNSLRDTFVDLYRCNRKGLTDEAAVGTCVAVKQIVGE